MAPPAGHRSVCAFAYYVVAVVVVGGAHAPKRRARTSSRGRHGHTKVTTASCGGRRAGGGTWDTGPWRARSGRQTRPRASVERVGGERVRPPQPRRYIAHRRVHATFATYCARRRARARAGRRMWTKRCDRRALFLFGYCILDTYFFRPRLRWTRLRALRLTRLPAAGTAVPVCVTGDPAPRRRAARAVVPRDRRRRSGCAEPREDAAILFFIHILILNRGVPALSARRVRKRAARRTRRPTPRRRRARLSVRVTLAPGTRPARPGLRR